MVDDVVRHASFDECCTPCILTHLQTKTIRMFFPLVFRKLVVPCSLQKAHVHNIQCVSDIHEVVQHVVMHNTGFRRMLRKSALNENIYFLLLILL